ncbi:NAD(P)H-dependent oxidoreductase [Porphyromonas sp. oral taxon 275]|jgi:nitroreductase|uniref:NAD(P)H-dependent oxidoreductase n=1 Tax=Porphyromonas sp. oral taxon 275 TaxID=712435 RepID=UPI001BAD6C1C|nr:NAD(P)H-dependent oxidoreductase [Porphyromonas sp. oral taxon 275]QUB43281.1 NAD(P)H-dependent oxidoreductase [Porphyromonas sp. oral taxon 275]
MSLIEDLHWRHAVKAYDPTKKLSQEDLMKIVEAARLAPTSSGLQQFRLIVVGDQDLKEKMVAGALNPDCMRECSHVIVFAAWDEYTPERIDAIYDLTTDERGLVRGRFKRYTDMLKEKFGEMDKEEQYQHAANQAYIALGMALAQAAELRIDSTPIGGFDPKLVDELLDLPSKGLRSVCLLYLGYADPERDWMGQMKKVRNSMEEFATFI